MPAKLTTDKYRPARKDAKGVKGTHGLHHYRQSICNHKKRNRTSAFISGGSRYITVTFTIDVATVENNSRPTEDKIDRPLYVTIFIILAAAFP